MNTSFYSLRRLFDLVQIWLRRCMNLFVMVDHFFPTGGCEVALDALKFAFVVSFKKVLLHRVIVTVFKVGALWTLVSGCAEVFRLYMILQLVSKKLNRV